MTLKEYLDECIKLYYSKVIGKFHFHLVETLSEGPGILYTYQNDSFKIRIVNDRGLINGELASLYDPDQYFDIYLFFAHIRLTVYPEQATNAWDKKMILSRTLSCEEETAVIDDHYSIVSTLLSGDRYASTIEAMNILTREHDSLLYGRPR
ncbi:hypothetical protein D3H65_26870 [Paraflavitalea soli]|uniref:Uncharacterized protein n=1 Tax=Paraflavitalea soli TaxID=2315862 RepID=A0A3B7N5N9_9BACT|nr:hypothetical protein [Paraflavitalea soli]AXY77381.1 hypothetical protein D3H65_26870 [Paraflavitalea soli]